MQNARGCLSAGAFLTRPDALKSMMASVVFLRRKQKRSVSLGTRVAALCVKQITAAIALLVVLSIDRLRVVCGRTGKNQNGPL